MRVKGIVTKVSGLKIEIDCTPKDMIRRIVTKGIVQYEKGATWVKPDVMPKAADIVRINFRVRK